MPPAIPQWNQDQVHEVDLALYALLSLMWEIKLISYKTLEIASTCNTKLLEVAEEW